MNRLGLNFSATTFQGYAGDIAAPSNFDLKKFDSIIATDKDAKADTQAMFVQKNVASLNYSIDHTNNALHLKITNADGELIREVVFARIDPSIFNAKRLKGVLVNAKT